MRWQDQRESDNVEDLRGEGGGGPGSGMPFPSGGMGMPGGGLGGGGVVGILVIVGLALLFGVDPSALLGGQGGEWPGSGRQIQLPSDRGPTVVNEENDQLKRFVSVILADTEDTWGAVFPKEAGRRYLRPKLVLFRGAVNSACGRAGAQMGPFYCPNDRKVYIDLSFYEQLKRRFHAPGEFAQAYVIAHEIGHHVQNLLGTLGQVQQRQVALGSAERNAAQVRIELQADCFAGVWAHNTNRIRKNLEPGDIEQAIRAAESIGDDAIQKRTRGYAVPDSFTHGSSEQRVRWFKRGYEGGTLASCNTFAAPAL